MAGWSIRTFAALEEIAELIVVTERDSIEPMRALIARVAPHVSSVVVGGGATRQQSVYEGLSAVSATPGAVLVHDGARPLVSAADVRAGMAHVRSGRASLLAVPVVDTIKSVDPQTMRVSATLERRTLWAAQTPQFATVADLRAAHERALIDGVDATDDAALLERIGVEVVAVPASTENFKVTLPADLERAAHVILSGVAEGHAVEGRG